ncbi:uncharacterized protein At2g24330 [Argentina anserina]|uniref:uncharacterized protein At2g24330 n=1 Tax=Argentina anserina TaxID=57926 RepID=UPI0021762BA5|nr:uncharacterized protein At2g24330 [Potentilla anserina]
MADDKDKGAEGDKNDAASVATPPAVPKKKRRGFFARMFTGMFRHGDDFEKRLQYLSKEEVTVVNRINRRALNRRNFTRNVVAFSIFFEIIAIGYAIATTRTTDLDWRTRTFRILPMFLFPALSAFTYTTFINYTRMRDRKDNKTLERLRAEKQAKIDELKEKTNYYSTQQLIQKYDADPAAKAAAATVLASKLGADSGLRFHVGDESKANASSGRSRDVELAHSGELRNRKTGLTRSTSTGSAQMLYSEQETPHTVGSENPQTAKPGQLVVAHQNPQSYATQDGNWIARLAALLVGEDPTQSYALICGNCHMHNGLAKKEDFAYITYYCPHCHALNRPKHLEGADPGSSTPNSGPMVAENRSDASNQASVSLNDSIVTGTSPVGAGTSLAGAGNSPVGAGTSPVGAGPEIDQIAEMLVSADTDTISIEEKHE